MLQFKDALKEVPPWIFLGQLELHSEPVLPVCLLIVLKELQGHACLLDLRAGYLRALRDRMLQKV